MKRIEADEMYEKFVGRMPEMDIEIELKDVKNLTLLGECFAVEYIAKKHGDKKLHRYRHEFNKGSLLLTNGKDIIIYSDTIHITKHGIEG